MDKNNDVPMYVQKPLSECRDRKIDCVSYAAGYCTALSDTEFKGDCPFYKSEEQNYKECMENMKKLRR